jgi:hypothetical protein
MIPLSSKEAASVMEAFEQIRMEYNEHFSEVFKTITTDRGIQSRISWQLFRKILHKAVQSSIITYD